MTRIVVVGAGLLGSAVADELAARRVDVTVVDAGQPGGGTSGSSFAWVNAQDKAPAAYFDLNTRAVAAYRGLADELGGDWYHPGGDVTLGIGANAPAVVERIARHRAVGYIVRTLDRQGLAALEPNLDLPADEDLAAAHFPDEAWIDAPALIERRLARAAERGATIVAERTVTGVEVAAGRARGVRTDAGVIQGDAVVLAAGPATESLAATAGVALPMAPTPGLLVTLAAPTNPIRHVLHAGDVALRPDGDGRVLVSSREVDGGLDRATRTIEPEDERCRELRDRAGRLVPALREATIARARIGVRSVAADGLPVTGMAPSLDLLYLLVAHSGATLAPVLGRLVAAELVGRRETALDPYRPDRFG